MKSAILTLCIVLSGAAQAAAAAPYTKIEFFGLNCTICEEGLIEKFTLFPAVAKVDVDMSNFTVCVRNKTGRELTPTEIKATLASAGFNTVKVEPTSKC